VQVGLDLQLPGGGQLRLGELAQVGAAGLGADRAGAQVLGALVKAHRVDATHAASAGLAAPPGDESAGPPAVEAAEDAPGDDPAAPVAAEQREYAAATSAWLSDTVHQVMRASDKLYAGMSHESVEALPDELVQPTGDDEPMTVSPMCVEASGTISTSGVVDGDLDDVHVMVATTAEQMLAQLMQAIFAHISAVADRTGNTVQADGDLVEAYIQAVQTMDIRFDDDGRPQFQVVAAPQTADKFREQFAAMSPDQARRLGAALAAKREEFHAARRRRRLPRHGH